MAINWVHENVQYFGGDKTKITLSGQSAGAVSTHLHMMSHYSRDKLAGAICFSGGAYNFWGVNTMEQAKTVSIANARLALCPEFFGSEVLVDCMRNVDAATIVANQILVIVSESST
jgi:carboxylesterase type B